MSALVDQQNSGLYRDGFPAAGAAESFCFGRTPEGAGDGASIASARSPDRDEKRRVCGVFLRCSAQMGGADGGHTPAVCARFQFAKSACLPYNRYGNMPIGAQFRPPTPASYNLTIVGVCPPAHDFGLRTRFRNALRGGNARMCEFQRRLLRHNTFVIVRIRSSARNFGRGCLDGNTLVYTPFRASAVPQIL